MQVLGIQERVWIVFGGSGGGGGGSLDEVKSKSQTGEEVTLLPVPQSSSVFSSDYGEAAADKVKFVGLCK